MAKKKEKEKYEISDFTPSWIDLEFPNESEYLDTMDVVKYYLIHSPCDRSSSRGTNVDNWGKPSIVLLDRIKDALGLEKGVNYDYGKSKPEMKILFDKYHLATDFTDKKEDIFIKMIQMFLKVFLNTFVIPLLIVDGK